MAEYGGSPYEQPPSSPQGSAKIFVGGLPSSVTSEGLISHFSAYGEVVDATIMNDKVTGRPRGFGFVTFRTIEAVDALMQEQHVLDGKQVECKRAVPMGYVDKPMGGGPSMGGPSMGRAPGQAPTQTPTSSGQPARYNPEKIFVGGLPISCDDNKLREYFSKYGVIVDAVVMIDRDLQRHRGFGYVLFQDASAVDAAVAEHDQHQIDGKWVDVKRCVVQENTAGGQQSGPMRKGYGKGGISSGMGMAPMPGVSATMPGYYGAPVAARPASGGYGGADYGTSQYYAKPAAPAQGMYGAKPAGGYMTSPYGAQPSAYGYGVAPADPYASSGYGQAAPSPYGAMPGYSTGYAGYGTSTGYGQTAPASGYGYGMPPTSAGAANPNDVYAASRRSGYRTSPY
jgi:RNA recognition motif-containing protein